MNELNEREAMKFLKNLFPKGIRDTDMLTNLCPDGWQASPLSATFHPSAERAFEEHLRFKSNLASLFRAKEKTKITPTPELSFQEFLTSYPEKDWHPSDIDLIEEPAELLGLCLWDIFSDNHDVINQNGDIVHLGSFRGSAGAIAEFFDNTEREVRNDEYWDDSDYMRFYMGTALISDRADLTPVYRLIFQHLKSQAADWRYAFPRIHLIDFGAECTSSEAYDPSTAVAKSIEQTKRDAETQLMRKRLERGILSDKRNARASIPPATVRAYQEVFERFPAGWPPDPYSPD